MSLGLMLIKGVDLILQNYVLEKYKRFKEQLKTKKEQETFKASLQDFADKFIKKHQGHVVETSHFADYLENYDVIGHVIDYYFAPNESPVDFCNKLSDKARGIIGRKYQIKPIDKSIEDFHTGLYDFVNQYFQSKTPAENTAVLHISKQNQIALVELKKELMPQKPIVKK